MNTNLLGLHMIERGETKLTEEQHDHQDCAATERKVQPDVAPTHGEQTTEQKVTQLDTGVDTRDDHDTYRKKRCAEHGDDCLLPDASVRREQQQQHCHEEPCADSAKQHVDARGIRQTNTSKGSVAHCVAEVGHAAQHNPGANNRGHDTDDDRGDERALHELGLERIGQPMHQ